MTCNLFQFLVNFTSVNLQARKPIKSCVAVTWTKKESGGCVLKYLIKFKNGNGDAIYTEFGNNVGYAQRCGIPSNVHITDVELTISFKSNTNRFQQKVLEMVTTTKNAPTTTAKPSGNHRRFLLGSGHKVSAIWGWVIFGWAM